MGNYYSTVTPEVVGDHILARVNGFVSKDFEATEETNGWRRWFFGLPWKKPEAALWSHAFVGFSSVEIKMHNARLMQDAWKGDKASFFERHGFVLVKSPTKVQD